MYYAINVRPFSRPEAFNNPAVIARAFVEGPKKFFGPDLESLEIEVVSHDTAKITYGDGVTEYLEIHLFEEVWEVQATTKDGHTVFLFSGSKQECLAQWAVIDRAVYTPQRIINSIKEI